ncbi:hypothetical protein [Halococcus saccharolyticus]|uniref:hypothetical protein n=1 Tax=Halococcus saccharolyticus TaxID=62319 RepID=UPI00145F47C8|nr:hypothetical protein [Halococcus saccharolyticus]
MNRVLGTGMGLTVLGLFGYMVGVLSPYPGRAVSITGVMAGVTLTVIGVWGAQEAIEP